MENEPINLLEAEPRVRKKVILISLITGLFLFWFILWFGGANLPGSVSVLLHPKSVGFFQTVKNFIFHTDPVLEGQTDDRINILVLGIGGAGHDGPYLSDTNIIVSLKPSTKKVSLISIPRDLGVKINDQGVRKINFADAYGELKAPGQGGDYARQVFSETFNISIPYYIRVDFKAFADMIDAVGGVPINVPRTFSDSQFPGENYSYRTIRFEAGPQTMDGQTALDFARSRHGDNGEGSDFARAHRQQLVLEALKQKLLSVGTYTDPTVVTGLLNSLSQHVATNLDLAQMMYLATLAKDITSPLKHLVLDNSPSGYLVSTTGENGAFLLFPRTGEYTNINEAIRDIFLATSSASGIAVTPARSPSPTTPPAPTTVSTNPTTPTPTTALFPNAKIEIQNGTWRAGLAARIRSHLQDKGYSVIGVGNSLKRPIDKTTIYLLHLGAAPATKGLSAYFKAPTLTVLPDWLQEIYDNTNTPEDERGMKYNRDADILIVLGADTQE